MWDKKGTSPFVLAHSDESEGDTTAVVSKEELQSKLARATKRIEELKQLKHQIKETGEVSLTDKEARLMSASNMGMDVAYNMQTAVDDKHHLIVAVDITNNPADQGQLYEMASQAKQQLGVDTLTVLADKGYYNGEELEKCEQDKVTTLVPKQKSPSVTGNPAYTLDKFRYDLDKDSYLCPQGQILNNVSKEDAKTKLYRSKACKTCPEKDNCTKNKRGRQIIHGEYHEVMARTDERMAKQPELYKQRQMIVEHPFGTHQAGLGLHILFAARNRKRERGSGYALLSV